MNFLNDSFKTLKNVLEEKINFEETTTDDEIIQENDKLKQLCQHQLEEIELLRKQIFDYQQLKLSDTRTLLESEKQKHANQQHQQQNDSWFWEPETTSSSTKDDDQSPAEADTEMTTIPLGASSDHEIIEKLRQQLAEKESSVKSLNVENAILNEKLKHLNAENLELNKSIEELDNQHQIAIEKVLDVKTSLQEKFNAANEEIKKFQQHKDELIKKYHNALDAKDAEKISIRSELEQLKISNDELTVKYEEQLEIIQKYENDIAELREEIKSLKENNSSPLEIVVNNDECLKKINTLINSQFKLHEEYIDEDQFMNMLSKWMSSTALKIREMDFEISKLIDENKHIKDESAKHILERDSLKSELINYEIECSELMKNNNILMADIENLRSMGGKLETIMENDDDEEVDGNFSQTTATTTKKSIDDEFISIKTKLESTEVERAEYFEQIQQLKKQLNENVARCKSYQEEIENLENDKSNYLFELNELKSEEERNILQKELKIYKDREVELLSRLEDVEKERSDIQAKYNELEKSMAAQLEALSTSQNNTVEENNRLLREKEGELSKALDELTRLSEMKEQLIALETSKFELVHKLDENEKLLSQLSEEKKALLTKCDELKKFNDANLENLKKSNEQVQELQKKLLESACIEELNAKIASLEDAAVKFTQEKEELVALLTTKHNESVQYHNEILRLNQVLQDETNKNQMAHNETLEQQNDQIKFLREKCELLTQNLLQEQNNYRLLQQEKNDAVEMNNTLNKDIERLRQHLLEVADAYTFEQVSLQKQVEEYKLKLMAVEAEAKQSATAYTSANIRANQQAETLQAQYNLLLQQRDDLLAKISAAEDNDNKNKAALTNLQIALEIFQRDKESDIELKTAALQKELDNERLIQMKLSGEINQLQAQLQEAKNGLMAAARLNDQLELNQLTIDKLNNEIASYQATIQSMKKQIELNNATSTATADIDLVKNLIVGYFSAPNANAKNQILKLISNVLNLSEAECVKVGLKNDGNSGGGWFSTKTTSDSLNNNVSLTEAFVSFLEKESQPRATTAANLLTIHEKETSTAIRKTSNSNIAREIEGDDKINVNANAETTSAPIPIVLSENTLLTSYNNRNSSSILKDILHDS
ncbi:hypothetical protein PVAND_002606 [Polypedilum vanderplanki]|uniref:GRIP domain-containing protein n=1 Tax=Polypedilum vanderplanki TaxID=319348 RepID=A0A9J6BRN9_POLVA|nr:hypothetical protein PVAND_002606 [Polypedilum vanderplanki]